MPDLALLATALAALGAGFLAGCFCFTRRHRHELDRLRQELQNAVVEARTDSLTGIGNRKAFDERLQLLSSLNRRHGTPFSMILIDVDHLKAVNDRAGHAAGDDLLRKLAILLLESIRESDFVARIGGDEFALLLPQTTPEGAFALLSRIHTASGKAIPVSGGVAGAAADEPPAELLLRADAALYSAKRGAPHPERGR